MIGVVHGVAAGDADTPELHQLIMLPLLIRVNWVLNGVVVVVGVCSAGSWKAAAVSVRNKQL